MMRRNPAPNLVEEIDALQAKLDARLADFVAEDKANAPGIPEGVLRNLLLKNSSNFFGAMRALLVERANG
jgi:hypothetical protein